MLERAEVLGQERASEEIELGFLAPDDEDLHTYTGKQDVLFEVTGEKLDPEDDDSEEIVDAYLRGYYDEWDEVE